MPVTRALLAAVRDPRRRLVLGGALVLLTPVAAGAGIVVDGMGRPPAPVAAALPVPPAAQPWEPPIDVPAEPASVPGAIPAAVPAPLVADLPLSWPVPTSALPPPASGPSTSPATPAPGADPTAGQPVPEVVLTAYQRATRRAPVACRLPWQLLAAFGKVASEHAFGGRVDDAGRTRGRILGAPAGPDTDGGRWDGDAATDRAIGLFQLSPTTWAARGTDGDGDGTEDPHDVADAALALVHLLCASGRDLGVAAGLDAALRAVEPSAQDRTSVRRWLAAYRNGVRPVASFPGRVPSPSVPLPTDQPTQTPSEQPTDQPTDQPSDTPSEQPTDQPTNQPTEGPTSSSIGVPTP